MPSPMSDGKIWTLCPKCHEKVWFDCFDRHGIDEFIKEEQVCLACKQLEKNENNTGPNYHSLDAFSWPMCIRPSLLA